MRKKIGIITPSSNTILEPISCRIISEIKDVSVHFSRFHVTEINNDNDSINQFSHKSMLVAAQMLSDARVDCIIWSGTSAGWLGLDNDRELCTFISNITGIPCSSSTLALKRIMDIKEDKTFGLVTPYNCEIQSDIIKNFMSEGYKCVGEEHYDEQINYKFSEISSNDIMNMILHVSTYKPDCITTFCTNLNAAAIVDELEKEIGIDIYDTVSLAVWEAFMLCKIDYSSISNWGNLFSY